MEPVFDSDIYGPSNKFEGYHFSIPINDDEDQAQHSHRSNKDMVKKMSSYTAPKHFFEETLNQQGDEDYRLRKPQRIIDKENDYRKRRLNRKLSPPRHDPFAAGDTSPDSSHLTYADVMREQALERLEHETYRAIAQKRRQQELDSREKEKEKEKDVEDRNRRYDLKGSGLSREQRRERVSGGGHTAAHSSKRRRP